MSLAPESCRMHKALNRSKYQTATEARVSCLRPVPPKHWLSPLSKAAGSRNQTGT